MDKSKYSKEARSVVENSNILDFADKMVSHMPKFENDINNIIHEFDSVCNYFSDNIGSVESYLSPMLNNIISKDTNKIDKDYFLFPTDSDSKTVYNTQHNILKEALTATKCLEVEESLYNLSKDLYTDYPSYNDFDSELSSWCQHAYQTVVDTPNEIITEEGYTLPEYFKQSLKIEQDVENKIKKANRKKGFCTFLIIVMIYNLFSSIIPFFMYYQDNMSIVEYLTTVFFADFLTILYIIILIVAIILRKRYKKFPERIRSKINEQTQECVDYYKACYKEKLFSPMNKIFKRNYKDRKDELERKYNELILNHKKLEKTYFEDKKALENYAKDFLPSRAADNFTVFSYVVECMSTGRAINYKDALFLAEQKYENEARKKEDNTQENDVDEIVLEISKKLIELKEEYTRRLNT